MENNIEFLKKELSYAYRICAKHNLNEGICNHLTISIPHPKSSSKYGASLCISYGIDWSEVTPESIIVFDNNNGEILEGNGNVETSAFYIHSSISSSSFLRFLPVNNRCLSDLNSFVPLCTRMEAFEEQKYEAGISKTSVRWCGAIPATLQFS